MNRRFPKHLVLPGTVILICAVWLIAGLFSSDLFGHREYDYTDPTYAEKDTYSAEEIESISEEFAANVENLYHAAKTTVNDSKIMEFAIKGAGEAVKEGRYIWNGIREASRETSAGTGAEVTGACTNIPFTVPLGCELASVIRAADGDTILVQPLFSNDKESSLFSLSEFSPVYVRLAGVNTPESHAAEIAGYAESTPEGEEASVFTKGLLTEGQIVWLSTATSDESDKYGRLLRLVWLDDPSDLDIHSEEAAAMTLNAELLREGYAGTLFIGEFEFEDLFKRLESQ